MNKNFGIGILILCFGLSSVNAALAAQIVDVPPIIVQPYDLREINQQMLGQDRVNRDQELAIRGLIDDNQKLTDMAMARQQDATLEKINQTMINYRDALLSRDRARIAANSQRVSKYHDLITLTENVDDMKGVGQTLQLKSNVIEEKYKILTELKDEMTALNEKLKGESLHKNFEKINQLQEEKIQLLTQRLGEMDQRIARYDEIVVQKDRQIARLKDSLAMAQSEAATKNEAIRWLNLVLAAVKNKAEYYQLTSQLDMLSMRQVQRKVQGIKDDFARVGLQLSRKQQQADLLKQELDSKIAQSAQMTLMMSDYQKKLESKDNAYNEQWGQILSSKNYQARMEKQIADLNARLQEKEAQVVKIKKDMYDLQEWASAKDRNLQAKDLSLSMIQQKMMDEKNNLALARQQIKDMPNSDEIDFLRTGLKKATAQLKQKDEMLSQIKANADKYAKEFKKQSQEFQSLKGQLQNAYEEIKHKNEDLKYKDMEIVRLKERSAKSNPHENNNALSKGDRLREKLKQALDKIDEQGRMINVLVQKLQEAGQSVNLTQYFAK